MIWCRSAIEQRQAETTIHLRRESLYGEDIRAKRLMIGCLMISRGTRTYPRTNPECLSQTTEVVPTAVRHRHMIRNPSP
jgi:hypothetical protein